MWRRFFPSKSFACTGTESSIGDCLPPLIPALSRMKLTNTSQPLSVACYMHTSSKSDAMTCSTVNPSFTDSVVDFSLYTPSGSETYPSDTISNDVQLTRSSILSASLENVRFSDLRAQNEWIPSMTLWSPYPTAYSTEFDYNTFQAAACRFSCYSNLVSTTVSLYVGGDVWAKYFDMSFLSWSFPMKEVVVSGMNPIPIMRYLRQLKRVCRTQPQLSFACIK